MSHSPEDHAARIALGDALFRYVEGRPFDLDPGSLDPNELAFAAYRLIPRVLRGQSGIDTGITFFGHELSSPLAVGAYAGDRILAETGIGPVADACQAMGLPLFVSEECVTPLREIVARHNRVWLQLRAAGPQSRAVDLIAQAARHGASGIVLTVLAPTHPRPGLQPGGFSIGREIAERGWSTIGSPTGIAPLPSFPAWSWVDAEAVAATARQLGLPVILKGILAPEDGERALQGVADAIMVSNIGGRQFGRWAAPVNQLSAIRERCGRAAPILIDGGIRNGGDVVIARALGADVAVMVRPVVLALAAGGSAAVRSLLAKVMDETAAVASWLGAATLDEIDSEQITRLPV
ncbi:alpha-hydroxy acid oxidase [Lichenifustis flavocetrariae]|uniref:Alpha-hydroxy-acid oxidizing protein n=1 Tax=Lichenifustis flavocetrariae TaxID=2949735 RepID=A0AA42CMU8_9HYPH|nr:alpha-hydroxy acid oxidase [Lichenifustis flavocetrariae]MCW6512888.1 alpha-hydroxy-acid oxidizing protein [Lichenifustis flavocetrariae]